MPAALPEIHARLDAGDALRVADVGCGGGWAGIALASRFPAVRVDGYDGDPIQRALYWFSLLVCLPDAMSGNPETATGTVMRPSAMDAYARVAGFVAAVPLEVEHDLWRFYELTR